MKIDKTVCDICTKEIEYDFEDTNEYEFMIITIVPKNGNTFHDDPLDICYDCSLGVTAYIDQEKYSYLKDKNDKKDKS